MQKNKIYEEKSCNNFRELIDITTAQFKDEIAFSIKINKKIKDITFNEFKNTVQSLGEGLLNLGLSNKKIALLSPDRYEWCCSYFAIATSGNIIVPLDAMLPHAELLRLIKESKVAAIIFDKKFSSLVEDITFVQYLICMDYSENKNNVLSYQNIVHSGRKLLSSPNSKYKKIIIDNDKLSVLIYTSGTTSNPKAVMLSQENICSNVSAMTTLIKKEPNDSILVFLPLHHTLACTASFLFCYYIGFRLCFADSIKDIGKNLKEYNISGLVCVPAVLELIYKQIIKGVKKSGKYIPFKILCGISNFLMFFHIDLRRKLFKEVLNNISPNMRTIIYGSAATDSKVIHLFNTIGIDMLQGYGLTETAPVISCESDKYHKETGSSGFPLYNEEVKIDSKNGEKIGEILVKGPNIMLGYYNNKTETDKVFKDGWFCTGDLGYLGKDGSLFVTGRKKDLIVLSNGKNVFPEELEALLNKIELVSESMIYEKDDKILAKIVYSKETAEHLHLTYDEIYKEIDAKIKNINKNLPVYKYIREFSLTDKPLIKTTTQKIKRHEEMKQINNS